MERHLGDQCRLTFAGHKKHIISKRNDEKADFSKSLGFFKETNVLKISVKLPNGVYP